MQGTAKQFNANLTLTFDEFKDKMLEIAQKKLGSKASNLETDDLTLGYNWGPAKDSLKTPPATGLEDEEDYEGTPFQCWHSSRVFIELLNLIVADSCVTRSSSLQRLIHYADFVVMRTSFVIRTSSLY